MPTEMPTPNAIAPFAAPPEVLDVALQFHAIRTVVPSVGEAVVNFGAGENETAALAEGDDVLEGILNFLCHFIILYRQALRRAGLGTYLDDRP